jgi:hypothetical protein
MDDAALFYFNMVKLIKYDVIYDESGWKRITPIKKTIWFYVAAPFFMIAKLFRR